jgi:hypothetical protein
MTLNGIAMKEKRNNIVIHCHLAFKVDRRFGGERQEGNGRKGQQKGRLGEKILHKIILFDNKIIYLYSSLSFSLFSSTYQHCCQYNCHFFYYM